MRLNLHLGAFVNFVSLSLNIIITVIFYAFSGELWVQASHNIKLGSWKNDVFYIWVFGFKSKYYFLRNNNRMVVGNSMFPIFALIGKDIEN